MKDADVALFADAGPRVGTGHLFRAFAVKRALGTLGVRAVLLTPLSERALADLGLRDTQSVRPHAGQIVDALVRTRAPTVVLDTYRFLHRVARSLDALSRRLAVFDDHQRLQNRVDVVINASPEASTRRDANRARRALLGPRFAAIHPAFRRARDRWRTDADVRRVLVALGGTDARRNMDRLLAALDSALPHEVGVDVLGSASHPRFTSLGWLTQDALAARLARYDLAILGGGSTLYQVAAVGLPVIAWPQTANQRRHALAWGRLGSVVVLPRLDSLPQACLRLRDARARARCSKAGRAAVDGLGALRIARAVRSLHGRSD